MSSTFSEAPNRSEQQPLEYRAISGLAIVALVFGFLSFAALLGPVMWFVPVLAAVLAVTAMRRIKASEGELTGWNIAFLALLLAVLFGVAGPAREISIKYWLRARARFVVDQYLDLLQKGDTYAAHQLTLPGVQRKPRGPGLQKVYETDEELKKRYDEFVATEPAKTMIELGKKARVDHEKTELVGGGSGREELAVVYRIGDAGAGAPTKEFDVHVRRSPGPAAYNDQWQIVLPRTGVQHGDHVH